GQLSNGGATAELVSFKGCICYAADDHRILVGNTRDEHDIRTHLLDSLERSSGTRYSLADHNGLNLRIHSELNDLPDYGLLLLHEVVRIGHVDDGIRILTDHPHRSL